jgi:enamine deaminase RidA (YjgF/YER057c/UK114 family)
MMQIFTTQVGAYTKAAPDLGPIYRRHMGRHFPVMALVGVTELVDPDAILEITATAVVPD